MLLYLPVLYLKSSHISSNHYHSRRYQRNFSLYVYGGLEDSEGHCIGKILRYCIRIEQSSFHYYIISRYLETFQIRSC